MHCSAMPLSFLSAPTTIFYPDAGIFPGSSGTAMQQKKVTQSDTQARISDAIDGNLEKVSEFARREDAKRTPVQRAIERVSVFFGRPAFLLGFVAACIAWVVIDMLVHRMGYSYFDAPPFSLLQGIITFIGVLITMAVLIRQNRLAKVEEDRAHLELQINLLAEQKTTKIIMLLEELRRDLPDVHDRRDEHAETLQAATNPDAVLDAIEQRKTNDA
jgi:uncharacterized membrane protein